MKMNRVNFRKIRELRLEQKISTAKMATLINKSKEEYKKFEAGKKEPCLNELIYIARNLGVRTAELLNEKI